MSSTHASSTLHLLCAPFYTIFTFSRPRPPSLLPYLLSLYPSVSVGIFFLFPVFLLPNHKVLVIPTSYSDCWSQVLQYRLCTLFASSFINTLPLEEEKRGEESVEKSFLLIPSLLHHSEKLDCSSCNIRKRRKKGTT